MPATVVLELELDVREFSDWPNTKISRKTLSLHPALRILTRLSIFERFICVCVQKLAFYSGAQHKFLRRWNFASSESLCLENAVISRLMECLCCLYEQVTSWVFLFM